MPSFVCDKCQETLKKPKLDAHVQRCRGASFSCIDCYKHFAGTEYRSHFSCISEVEKYEKRKPGGEKPNKGPTQRQDDNHNKKDGRIIGTDGPNKDGVSDETTASMRKKAKIGEIRGTETETETEKRLQEPPKPTNLELIKQVLSSQGSMNFKSLLKVLKKQHGLSKKSLLKRMKISCSSGGDLMLTITE